MCLSIIGFFQNLFLIGFLQFTLVWYNSLFFFLTAFKTFLDIIPTASADEQAQANPRIFTFALPPYHLRYFCGAECEIPEICEYPSYCPEGSINPLKCPLGWKAAEESGLFPVLLLFEL